VLLDKNARRSLWRDRTGDGMLAERESGDRRRNRRSWLEEERNENSLKSGVDFSRMQIGVRSLRPALSTECGVGRRKTAKLGPRRRSSRSSPSRVRHPDYTTRAST
jgi:hypothetical protein